ncbi:hypothetical protein FOXYS1_5961 [Fusarium oxysporum]|uniref:Major facilitator superfamily (MFS) profile domain-containing protein n=1 Tax=Fusarium oxysporum TaxID=5507 RepID=A0A8H5ADF3_FUSOX|nr:hypothetical protein FOXYS1_5961 [Fusarium oxysporum]
MTESRSSPTEGNIITPANSNDSSNKHHYEMAEEHETTAVFVFTAKEGKAVKRKIDFILLPMLCACYIFSFLDKTLLNYASIFGIKEALGLEGSDYSWLGSIFYIGYMIGSMVWAKLVQRWPGHAGKFIAGAVCAWSIIVLLTVKCTNFAGIATIRFFLGLCESIIGPVFVIITSNWWTRPEQAFRTAFWLSGTPIGNFFGGILSYALGLIHGSIATWKIFFLFFGSLSLAFSFVLMYLMPDNQSNARWLDERQKTIAIERVRENQTVTKDSEWKWHQFWEALRDPQTVFFFVTAMGNTMPSTFASQFSSQIVKGFGFTAIQTTLISTCPAAVIQLLTFLVFSFHSTIDWGFPSAHTTDNKYSRPISRILLNIHVSARYEPFGGLMASNYAGNTKKSTASGIIFAGWAAGLIAGPQFFLEREAPTYDLAFKMLMGCYALMVVLPILQLIWYKYENARRDKLCDESVANTRPEFTDETDFEKWRTFRYTM